ncbi:MAG: 2-C-methyl-D-erythritol 4-phosphate cytidylyltransferase [bacterium]
MICAIVPCGGAGRRMERKTPKAFLTMEGRPILFHTMSAVKKSGLFDRILVPVPKEKVAHAARMLREWGFEEAEPLAGGASRRQSVWNAVRMLPDEAKYVVVHDGVRPLASPALFHAVLKAAKRHGAAITAIPCTDTVKTVRKGRVAGTADRGSMFLVQTPQAFRAELLREAHREAARRRLSAPDDAALVERLGAPVAAVPGERWNIKITVPEDLTVAAALLRERG